MIDAFGDATLRELAAALAITVTVGGFLIRGLLWVVPRVRRFGRAMDEWIGVPPDEHSEGRPGVLARLETVEEQAREAAGLARQALAQLQPNGGTSAKDQLDRMERLLRELESRSAQR